MSCCRLETLMNSVGNQEPLVEANHSWVRSSKRQGSSVCSIPPRHSALGIAAGASHVAARAGMDQAPDKAADKRACCYGGLGFAGVRTRAVGLTVIVSAAGITMHAALLIALQFGTLH